MKAKLAIVGYGKMGKLVASLAPEFDFEVVSIIDPTTNTPLSKENLNEAQVAIEFTVPQSAVNNYRQLLEWQVPIVTGTTGWYQHLDTVRQWVSDKNGSFLYASNFSIGMNLMFKVAEQLAKLTAQFPDYHISIKETHHIHKKDVPSGTAITLANKIVQNHPRYKTWTTEQPFEETLFIQANREGEVIGNHRLIIDSAVDTLILEHNAKNREGFARGALVAAKFLLNRKGFYTIEDLLTF